MTTLRVARWHCHCRHPKRVPVAIPADLVAVLRRMQVPPEATVVTFKCRCGVIEVPARAFGVTLNVASPPHHRVA